MQSNTDQGVVGGLGSGQTAMGGPPGMGGQQGMGGQTGMGNTTGSNMGGNGDPVDKGVDFLERRAGHEQSHSTTEKISDGLRKGFQKVTGKDVPIQDKQYS